MNVKQVEDSENRYGVFKVFVYSHSTVGLYRFLSKAHPAAPILPIFLKYLLKSYAVYMLTVCILMNY